MIHVLNHEGKLSNHVLGRLGKMPPIITKQIIIERSVICRDLFIVYKLYPNKLIAIIGSTTSHKTELRTPKRIKGRSIHEEERRDKQRAFLTNVVDMSNKCEIT